MDELGMFLTSRDNAALERFRMAVKEIGVSRCSRTCRKLRVKHAYLVAPEVNVTAGRYSRPSSPTGGLKSKAARVQAIVIHIPASTMNSPGQILSKTSPLIETDS